MTRWQIWLLVTGMLLAIGACNAKSSGVHPIKKGDEYVAIGDSYTAAPALGRPANACLRTATNYPHRVAAKLGLRLRDVSCAGAATANVTAAQTTPSTLIPPQADALSRGTDLVTISLGANDFNTFRAVAIGCTGLRSHDPAGAPCARADAAASEESIENKVAATEQNLSEVIEYVAKRSPSARIIVVGYPEFFPEAGPCAQFPLAVGDYAFAHRINVLLVRAQKRAAARTNVEYVDVFAATRGHDMCARKPWIAGVRSTRSEAMPLHPFHEEQQLVADLVLRQLS